MPLLVVRTVARGIFARSSAESVSSCFTAPVTRMLVGWSCAASRPAPTIPNMNERRVYITTPFIVHTINAGSACSASTTLIFLQDMRFYLSLQVVTVLAVSAFVASSLPCFGQAGKSELFGTVSDSSSLPIKGAKISEDEVATGAQFQTVSGDSGDYHLLGLPAGLYTLTIEQPVFRTYKQTGIVLRLTDQTQMNIQMQVGLPTQSVEVHAEAPPTVWAAPPASGCSFAGGAAHTVGGSACGSAAAANGQSVGRVQRG